MELKSSRTKLPAKIGAQQNVSETTAENMMIFITGLNTYTFWTLSGFMFFNIDKFFGPWFKYSQKLQEMNELRTNLNMYIRNYKLFQSREIQGEENGRIEIT